MAITKLMNIKQGKRGGSQHLFNSIRYVMKGEKTEEGLLIGGNSGTTPEEVYRTMLDTKADWEKPDGRQGYHFVISWMPGETDEQTAYEVVKEFCQEYLADHYDYVFAVHNDKGHMHGHIVFNSVCRTTGYKYRYVKGDWEKQIQPVTDRICIRHGLKPLTFEEQRKGCSYAQWAAEKNGKSDWKKIIRADVDMAISQTATEEEFLNYLQKQGYRLHKGYSRKHGKEYVTFYAPGQKRGWRSYNLGAGYDYPEIMARLKRREQIHFYERIPKIKSAKFSSIPSGRSYSGFQIMYLKKWYVVGFGHWRMRNPYAVNQAAVRKELLQIDRLKEECRYLINADIQSVDQLAGKKEELQKKEKELNNQKYSTEFFEEDAVVIRYKQLQKQLAETPVWDDQFEEIEDELEKLEEQIPDGALDEEKRQEDIRQKLSQVRDEKRLVNRILKRQEESELLVAAWSRERKERIQWQRKQEKEKNKRETREPKIKGNW